MLLKNGFAPFKSRIQHNVFTCSRIQRGFFNRSIIRVCVSVRRRIDNGWQRAKNRIRNTNDAADISNWRGVVQVGPKTSSTAASVE